MLIAGWDDAGNQASLAAFRQGLEERGFREGATSELFIKYAQGDPARSLLWPPNWWRPEWT